MPNHRLIVGLGNPESRYQYTRHNSGFLWVQSFAAAANFPDFTLVPKFKAQLTRATLGDSDVLLAQPQTYMNASGDAVQALVHYYRLDPATDLLVVFDDLDLPFGQFKFTTHPPRTHNGLYDIKNKLDTPEFQLLRLGVDDRGGDRRIPAIDYVLTNFSPAQLSQLETDIFPATREAVHPWL